MIKGICKWFGCMVMIYAALAAWTIIITDTLTITIMGLVAIAKGI